MYIIAFMSLCVVGVAFAVYLKYPVKHNPRALLHLGVAGASAMVIALAAAFGNPIPGHEKTLGIALGGALVMLMVLIGLVVLSAQHEAEPWID